MAKILVLIGPTSSGKTSLALELGKETGAEILSSDSRQVYRYMDIGTGKIPVDTEVKIKVIADVWYMNGVAIHGYNLADPDHYFSAYDQALFTLKHASDLMAAGKKVMIVGGGGFYNDIITGRIKLNRNAPDFEVREQLEKESIEDLRSKLAKLNKVIFESIDKNNKPRLVRAIEHELSQKKQAPLPYLSNVDFVYYGLTAPRDYLYARTDKWVDTVWDNGLLEETKFLLKRFPRSNKLKGHVYSSTVEFLTTDLSADVARQKIKWDLHSYVRRQFTWFNKNKETIWLNIKDLSRNKAITDIIKAVYG